MPRREALNLVGKLGLSGLGATLLGGCKGHTTPEPEPEPPPTPVSVDILVRFYNHTQGYIGERTYSGLSGTSLPIKASDCPDLSSVDPQRLAVRGAAKDGWLGKLVEYSGSGQLVTAAFPRQDQVYDAFLMNKTNGADYALIDSFPSSFAGQLPHSPDATWYRYDDQICAGPDEIPREAMRQAEEALVFPWAKYVGFREQGTYGHFFVGYRCPDSEPAVSWRGYAHESGAWVNQIECGNQRHPLLKVFLEQIFKHLTGCIGLQDVAPGGLLTYQYMTDDYGLNAIGRDLLAYVPIKDIKCAAG